MAEAANNAPAPTQEPLIKIRPVRGWMNLNLAELWQYRDLFAFMVWRDIKIKYKQTALGVAWAILVPLLQTMIFTVIFGRVAKLPSFGLPYVLFYLSVLVLWNYFSTSATMSSNSLVGNAHLLTKIYLPRLIVPTSPVLAGLMDFCISFTLLALLMVYFQVAPSITIIFLPIFLVLACMTALGTGLILSALNVKFRDIKYVIPFLLQMWMYLTVIIPFEKIPERFGVWRYLYGLNPMAGIVEMFRWCLLRQEMITEKVTAGGITVMAQPDAPLTLFFIGLPVTLILFVFGLFYFKRMERQFADVA